MTDWTTYPIAPDINYDYSGGTNLIYIGEVESGSASLTSQNVWRITKLTYDASDNVTQSRTLENVAWDNRASIF